MKEWTEVFKKHRVRLGEGGWRRRAVDAEDRYLWTSKLKSGGRWLKWWEIKHRSRQTDHVTCVATGRIFTLCIAMRAKNYSERQNWRHQFRGQHEWNKARCKRVVLVVAVGGNCTRDVCSCTSLSMFVYRVRALSAATSIYTRPVCREMLSPDFRSSWFEFWGNVWTW